MVKICKRTLILLLIFIIILVSYSTRENFNTTNKIKVYCINRLSRPDRLSSFWERIKNTIFFNDLDVEIVPAVDKDNLQNVFSSTLPLGAIGCFYSHVKCFLDLLSTNKNVEYCLIFEDDTICKDDLKQIISEFLNKNENYDMLILGDNYREGSIECVNDDKIKMEICKGFTMIFGSHAYIINKKAANILLSGALPIQKAYDLYFSDPTVYKDLKVGLTKTSVCTVANINDSNTV